MDGFYTEQLIRKRKSVKDLMIEVLLLAVTIVSAAVVFIHFVGIILLIVMIIIDVFVFRAPGYRILNIYIWMEILRLTKLCIRKDVKGCFR